MDSREKPGYVACAIAVSTFFQARLNITMHSRILTQNAKMQTFFLFIQAVIGTIIIIIGASTGAIYR